MTSSQELLNKAQELNESNEYNKVIELLSDELLNRYKSADLYAEKAQAYCKLELTELSEQSADSALAINPEHAKGNYYKGVRYRKLKKNDYAINAFNKAIKTNPKLPYPYIGLGNIYDDLYKYDEAITLYEKAIELDPNSVLPYNGLGDVFRDLKQYDKAINYYEKAIEIDPKYSYAYSGMGYVYTNMKRYNEAITFFKKAIETDSKNPHSYNGLGSVYKNQQKTDEAIIEFNKVINLDPEFSGAYFNRGSLYYDLKKYADALWDYEKKIELTNITPDNYFRRIAQEKVIELKKLLEINLPIDKRANELVGRISFLVIKIKELLLYQDGYVTHYTSMAVANKLILEKSPFQLSEGSFLNDTSEGRELFKFLPPIDIKSTTDEGKLDIEITTETDKDTEAKQFAQRPFIGSFVPDDKHDNLTLWRMYGKEEKNEALGCAITIDMKKLVNNLKNKLMADDKPSTNDNFEDEFRFYRVAYRTHNSNEPFIIPGADAKKVELNKLMSDLKIEVTKFKKHSYSGVYIQKVKKQLNGIAYLFKTMEYQHEQELRLVVSGSGFKKEILQDPIRVYIELVELTPLITKITFGPKVEKAEERAAFYYYTFTKDGNQPDIFISHLPFK